MNDHCPVEATLDMIGGKYKALILWHLSDGQLRFSELRKVITSATPKMLTQQLRELENQAKQDELEKLKAALAQDALYALMLVLAIDAEKCSRKD